MSLSSQDLAVAGLYTALLKRAPDASGFGFWLDAAKQGASTVTLAQAFLGTPEGQALFPAVQTNEQFVTRLYESVLGRAPDPEGLAFWMAVLASHGGASNTDACAVLAAQVIDVISTPLASKPADLSDAAYLQTVSDRARFLNQAEFGVYFANTLNSNDRALASSALSLVTANAATLAFAKDFAARGGAIADGGGSAPPEPTLALSHADSIDDITAKFAAYTGSAATVDASDMTAAQLVAVAAGHTKIAPGGVSKLTLTLADALIVDDVATALLSKASGAQVDASGANAASLAVLAGNLNGVAEGGISGLTLVLSDWNNADATSLLSKATAATVQVGSASMTQLDVLATHIANVADGSLSDAMALTDTQLATMSSNVLNAKLVGNAALSVTGGPGNSVIDLSGLSHAVTVNGGAGADLITLGGNNGVVTVNSAAETRSAAFSVDDTTTANIDRIQGMQNNQTFQLSTAADAFGDGLTLTRVNGSDIVYHTLSRLGVTLDVGSFSAIYADVNAQYDGNVRESSDTSFEMFKIEVTSQSGLSGSFLIINDKNPIIDGRDMIISLGNSTWNDSPHFVFG